jgi:succinate dehydrogenase assembly factor 1
MFGIRHSGLQLQVLALYRTILAAVREKPKESQPAFKALIRAEFDKNLQVKRTDIAAIEFLMRQAKKRLEVLKRKETTSVSVRH